MQRIDYLYSQLHMVTADECKHLLILMLSHFADNDETMQIVSHLLTEKPKSAKTIINNLGKYLDKEFAVKHLVRIAKQDSYEHCQTVVETLVRWIEKEHAMFGIAQVCKFPIIRDPNLDGHQDKFAKKILSIVTNGLKKHLKDGTIGPDNTKILIELASKEEIHYICRNAILEIFYYEEMPPKEMKRMELEETLKKIQKGK